MDLELVFSLRNRIKNRIGTFRIIATNISQCVKSVRIWVFSGPYLVRMRENTDQENSECEHFLSSVTEFLLAPT